MNRIKFLWICAVIMGMTISLFHCGSLVPPKVDLQLNYSPIVNESAEKYSVEENGAVAYDLDGAKVVVKPMTDERLNKMFPDISYNEGASTNPYTYGNWKDIDLGYTPTRFTVFVVKVFNYARPKINLNQLQAELTTKRGDKLLPYARDKKESSGNERNFESYYTKRKGASGVERNRYEERMGIVRKTLYTDGPVYKGDNKEGFIVFDPLPEQVNQITLTLKDFVLQYDANDWPQKKIDISFTFNRELEKVKVNKTEE